MSDDEITAAHVEKETLQVAVYVPAHGKREGSSPLFDHSRDKLIAREGGRCWVCGRTAEEAGHPLEAHHHPVERCFAEEMDWELIRDDCLKGAWGPSAQAFDWVGFFEGAAQVTVHVDADLVEPAHDYAYLQPKDVYLFVDDMTVNGELLCKDHHTVGDEGKHTLPYPIWVAQRYAREGVKFSDREVIHRAT
jgi:hypothetical protein